MCLVRFDGAQMVITWLNICDDPDLQRMAVAMYYILVAVKPTTEETTQLGAEAFMVELLGIVQERASMGIVDATLRFALSVLWSLTDECPTASHHFIQCHGLELYQELLETYHRESDIQKSVLGLLNNVAEVVDLRIDLMDEDLHEYLLSLLDGAGVDISVRYFAGGILAHLLSTGESNWTLDLDLRDIILRKLHSAILTWTTPEEEMVSYRSFRPFYPLLHSSQPTSVQLWAAWAVHLVCEQNASLYAEMLQEEGGLDIVKELITHPDTHDDVRRLAEGIVGISETDQEQPVQEEGDEH